MLAPVERQAVRGVGEPAVEFGEVGAHFVAVGVQAVHAAREVAVPLQLRGQHGRRRADVAQRGVGVRVVPPQVEARRRRQVARLLAVEDHLHVDQAPVLHLEGHPGPTKLGEQDRQVEAPDVEAREIARLQQAGQGFCRRAEGVFVGHEVVGDPVDVGGLGRDRHLGVVAADLLEDIALRRHPDDRQLDDSVAGQAQARGFEVEEGDRPVKIEGQFHGGLF